MILFLAKNDYIYIFQAINMSCTINCTLCTFYSMCSDHGSQGTCTWQGSPSKMIQSCQSPGSPSQQQKHNTSLRESKCCYVLATQELNITCLHSLCRVGDGNSLQLCFRTTQSRPFLLLFSLSFLHFLFYEFTKLKKKSNHHFSKPGKEVRC